MNRMTNPLRDSWPVPEVKATASTAGKPAQTMKAGETVRLPGRLEYRTVGATWRDIASLIDKEAPRSLILDASGLSYCDAAGAALILRLERDQRRRGGELALTGASPEIANLLDLYHLPAIEAEPSAPRQSPRWIEAAGAAVRERGEIWLTELATFGATARAVAGSLPRLRRCRGSEILRLIEADGARALPIVLLLGVLMGVIIAFQAAIQLRRFGAELYIANLLALASFRQLGPFLTAVILAGRSGAEFAAEIGTMKIGEEVDALVTMGFDPISFLVLPRLVALMIAAPLLTLFTDLGNLAGGLAVFKLFGFTAAAYAQQVLQTAHYGDLLDGIAKSVLFGTLIAFTGCLRGLEAGGGARAVGFAATSAVVSSLVLIIVFDGIWSVAGQYV